MYMLFVYIRKHTNARKKKQKQIENHSSRKLHVRVPSNQFVIEREM